MAPENDDVHLNILLNDLALNGFTPKIGGNISCQGYLYAAPDQLISRKTSWLDSGEVAQSIEKRDSMSRAVLAYDYYVDYSIAMGAIAGALEQKRWKIINDSMHHSTRNYPSLTAESQNGTKAVFLIDSMLNGHAPHFPFTAEMAEYWRKTVKQQWGDGSEITIAKSLSTTMNTLIATPLG